MCVCVFVWVPEEMMLLRLCVAYGHVGHVMLVFFFSAPLCVNPRQSPVSDWAVNSHGKAREKHTHIHILDFSFQHPEIWLLRKAPFILSRTSLGPPTVSFYFLFSSCLTSFRCKSQNQTVIWFLTV